MNAAPILDRIAAELSNCALEAVLIGNSAAALRGAPVTTLDFDFMFRKTPANIKKLKRLADQLGGMILRPFYPVSGLYRLVVEESGLQLDFMSEIHGVSSFESLRSRASEVKLKSGVVLWVADLDDIVRSKQEAGRPRDLAVLDILKETQNEIRKQS